ncbi:MAG: DUF3987 domain-containing protein [Bacteroidetes bacterium]|jgi:hypothetical protein|nr:MAG: DUF3987 domain-containing protein [Bacteroidota bacterium]
MEAPINLTPEKVTNAGHNGQESRVTEQGIIDEAGRLAKNTNCKTTEQNRFPVEVFPLLVQEIIFATVKDLGFPADFISASVLFAASVAIGNTHRAEVKKGFQESAVLYVAMVARPGTNKTHPLHFALLPIIEADKTTFNQYEQQLKEYNRVMNLSKKEREQEGIEDPLKPVWQKVLLSDYTPEALAEVHKFNKKGIAVYVDELAGWFKNFNRYNSGSEMEFWLSAWNSKPITIDRKTGEPILISKPHIPVGGTIQNALLIELAKDGRMLNGFMDRILFACPDNIKKPYWTESEVDQSIIDSWQNITSKLLNMTFNLDDTFTAAPKILNFSQEAKKVLFRWQQYNTDQCNEESETISAVYSKMDMYVVRLALILELLDSACTNLVSNSISVGAVEGSIQLVEYFKKAAVKVHSIIANANPLDRLSGDRRRLYETLPDTFTTEEGVRIATAAGTAERTFKRFLTDKEFFSKSGRGEYEKKNK